MARTPPQKHIASAYLLPCTCDSDQRLRRVSKEELQRFQGNLKTLRDEQYAKLKASMQSKGFFAPVFVWAGHTHLLDGHQRLNVLEHEQWDVEGGIPVVDIEATDEKDAAEKLLLLSSTYGKVDPQGLYEFTETHGVKLTEFTLPDLPDFDLPKFTAEYYDVDGEMPTLPEGDKPPFQQVTFTLHNSQAEEVQRAVERAKAMADFAESPNENSNGNALAFICATFLTDHGLS